MHCERRNARQRAQTSACSRTHTHISTRTCTRPTRSLHLALGSTARAHCHTHATSRAHHNRRTATRTQHAHLALGLMQRLRGVARVRIRLSVGRRWRSRHCRAGPSECHGRHSGGFTMRAARDSIMTEVVSPANSISWPAVAPFGSSTCSAQPSGSCDTTGEGGVSVPPLE